MDLTTIIFIGLAIFVAWRLRSVLGEKTGTEQPPQDPFPRRERAPLPDGDGKVVRLPGAERPAPVVPPAERWTGLVDEGSPAMAGLEAIAAAEPFDPREFVEGAKMAYEMIVGAFAAGDRKALKPLLAKDVYEGFDAAITEREKAGHRVETTFVSLDEARIIAAELRGRSAQVTIRFVSSLISATRDASGAVVEGSADAVASVTDIWTFARTVGSRDPNWQLVATEGGQ